LTRELYIERDDFMEVPAPKFHRLAPGREVRLRYGYVIRCDEVVRDENGEISELHCTYAADTGGGKTPDGRKVKGIIHWVSASHSTPLEVHLFDRLFDVEDVGSSEDFRAHLNPGSLNVVTSAIGETLLANSATTTFQFERLGYFCRDTASTAEHVIFNRCVSLRDTWTKISHNKST